METVHQAEALPGMLQHFDLHGRQRTLLASEGEQDGHDAFARQWLAAFEASCAGLDFGERRDAEVRLWQLQPSRVAEEPRGWSELIHAGEGSVDFRDLKFERFFWHPEPHCGLPVVAEAPA